MNYTWEITSIETSDLPGAPKTVVQTRWKKIGTDESGLTGEFIGATPFKLTEGADFTPFESLTEAQVLSWIQEAASKYEDHIHTQIQRQIDAKKAPKITISQFPWLIK